MSEKDRIILQKIAKYIKNSILFVNGMSYGLFINDEKTMAATAFMLGQIGEVAKEISEQLQNANPQIPWKVMRGMRNRIIHDYDNVDVNVVWHTITENLPDLYGEVMTLLDKE
ncbi:MAG: DUF86 domain-containing protein [Firmicutes bacterium]|nr:DUF86 domain-containing protein [Bacillota bacterium]